MPRPTPTPAGNCRRTRRTARFLGLLLLITLAPTPSLTAGLLPRQLSPAPPSYTFPGSVTICRSDYYSDCTAFVELPASVQRRCTNVPADFNDRISSFEVKNGCCEFHRRYDCIGGVLLVACNEKRGTLLGLSSNQISSWRCYFGEK